MRIYIPTRPCSGGCEDGKMQLRPRLTLDGAVEAIIEDGGDTDLWRIEVYRINEWTAVAEHLYDCDIEGEEV